MDRAKLAAFRKRMMNDPNFRKKFAADPADALRSAGIDVPPDVKLAPIPERELESRITALENLRTRDTLSREADLANFITEVERGRLGGDPTIYTISAFGTLDW